VAFTRPNFRQAAKIRASAAFILAGAGLGAGLYFSNLAYVKAGDQAARAAAAERQVAAEQKATAERRALAERQPANGLVALLSESSSDRNAINGAYNDVGGCGSLLGQDQATFQQAATSRQSLITQLKAIPDVSALPVALVVDLTAAWRASEQVDQDYARWAADEHAKAHCAPLDYFDLGYAAAVGSNYQATVDKAAALELWNPIAEQFGLPTYNQAQI
jgi:hypothetical protein